MNITLQDVILRMVSGGFRFNLGLYFKSLWRLNEPLFGFYSGWRLPLPSGERLGLDPQALEQELGHPRFQVAESEFWWLPGVGYRKKYRLYSLPNKQGEEWFDHVNWRGIKRFCTGREFQVVSSKPVENYRCESPYVDDDFYCNPVNADAHTPDLSGTQEFHYLRPLLAAIKIELVGEGTYLDRPVVLLRGVPRPEAELEQLPLVGWFGPEDWWLIADYYEMALDMREGLLLHYRGLVKEGVLVEARILELDTSNEDARSERVFQV